MQEVSEEMLKPTREGAGARRELHQCLDSELRSELAEPVSPHGADRHQQCGRGKLCQQFRSPELQSHGDRKVVLMRIPFPQRRDDPLDRTREVPYDWIAGPVERIRAICA